MIATAAWILAGIALWFSRGVIDVFDAAGRSTRVAVLPSAPELAGLVVLSMAIAATAGACVRRWTTSPEERADAFLQISLPLFGLLLVVIPYLPWLADEIEALRALGGHLVYIIWFLVSGQVLLTFLRVRSTFRPPPSRATRYVFGTFGIPLITAAISWTAATILRNTSTGVGLADASSGGYHAPVWVTVVLAALTAVLMWRWVLAFTGSGEAATFAWAAVFLGAPVLFTSISVFADIPAALCVMLAFAWNTHPQRTDVVWGEYLVRGLAVSALPWLSTTYAPMAAALVMLLGLRAVQNPKAVLALLVPFTVSLVKSLAVYQPQAFGNPVAGIFGLLFDQEFGVLEYAPALVIGFVGLWQMLAARDQMVRRRGREVAAAVGVLLVTTGALAVWWGGPMPPGRPLVPVLPLLGLPMAWAYLGAPARSVRRGAYQLLLLVGMAVSLSMLLTDYGELIVQDRDGSSRLLQWVTMLWPVWQVVPSIAVGGLRQSSGLIALWIAAALTVAWVGRRNPLQKPGASALMATINVSAAVMVVSLLAPAFTIAETPSVTRPEARSGLPLLDNFDSVARPRAIIYRPFTVAQASEVPPLMTLTAEPGRAGWQPVQVLLNARYALAAGNYSVEIGGFKAGEPVRGVIGLQVGRIGSPLHEWQVDLAPGATWHADFSLPVDSEFVGFVGSDSLASPTSLRITPLKIVNRNNRESTFRGPPLTVLSSLEFPSASVFFHDVEAYPERGGMWVRGKSVALMTVAPAHPDQPLTLRVHAGARPNVVTFATTTWGERVELTPWTPREVHIPGPARPGPFLLRVATENSFVPAETVPGSTDQRPLGCWIEIAN